VASIVNLYKDEYDVYIGRPGKNKDGYFGNPVTPGVVCFVCDHIHDKGDTLACYEQYVRARITFDDEFKRRLKELDGKILGCFCKPKACHGDVLINIIAELQ